MSFWSTVLNLIQGNKVSVYVAIGDDMYMRATGKLQSAGVAYYTKIRGTGRSQWSVLDNRMSEYEIYVKREDEHKARVAIDGG